MSKAESIAEEGADGAPAPRVVERFGVEGVDFFGIWHAPEAPFVNLMWREELPNGRKVKRHMSFSYGLLVTTSPQQEEAMEHAARLNPSSYVKADPSVTSPFECEMEGCHTAWYSKQAFSRHMKFRHTSSYTRR